RQALDVVVARHDILRTSMHLDGYSQPLQLVHGTAEIPLAVHDIRALSADEQHELALAYAENEQTTEFDLTTAPLVRIAVHIEADDVWRLTFSHIHAITEGWSYHTLLMELLDVYRGLSEGREPTPYEAPSVRFADFIAAEQASLADESDQTFWQRVVRDHAPLAIPKSWGAAVGSHESLRAHAPYSDLEAGLRRLAGEAKTSLKSVLLAAHLKVLGSLTADPAFHTGVVYHGRLEAPGADRVLGMHLNTLPFPAVKGAARTWRELVEEVYRQETEIWSHRRYPLPAIQRAAGGDLLSILFEYLDFHQVDTDTVDASGTQGSTSNEFGLNVIARNGRFSLFSTSSLVSRESLDRLAGMYRLVLEAMAADAGGDARGVLLSEGERGVLLGEWAEGGQVGRPDVVVDRFEAQVAVTPGAVAVVAGDVRLSYAEVEERANQVAHHLIASGAGPDSLVGVCLER
ncbi:condensation domain-containing protein, partial [Streptomyces bauhiniae]